MRAKYSQRKRTVGEGIKKWQMQSRKSGNIYYRFFALHFLRQNKTKHAWRFLSLWYRTLRWS
jgi:hypothetical protein